MLPGLFSALGDNNLPSSNRCQAFAYSLSSIILLLYDKLCQHASVAVPQMTVSCVDGYLLLSSSKLAIELTLSTATSKIPQSFSLMPTCMPGSAHSLCLSSHVLKLLEPHPENTGMLHALTLHAVKTWLSPIVGLTILGRRPSIAPLLAGACIAASTPAQIGIRC